MTIALRTHTCKLSVQTKTGEYRLARLCLNIVRMPLQAGRPNPAKGNKRTNAKQMNSAALTTQSACQRSMQENI